MSNITDDDLSDIVNRWEESGLLTNLPRWEKEELAVLYDNAARLTIFNSKKMDRNIQDCIDQVTFPIIRRVYRRVGVSFDMEFLFEQLLSEVKEQIYKINGPVTKESNPIVDFCVNFADKYEDENTLKLFLTNEEYSNRIDKITTTLVNILKNDKMISYVNRNNLDWEIFTNDDERGPKNTRMWNQKIATEFLSTVLNDTNKGI